MLYWHLLYWYKSKITCCTGTKVHILTYEILRRYNRFAGTKALVFLAKKSKNIEGQDFFLGSRYNDRRKAFSMDPEAYAEAIKSPLWKTVAETVTKEKEAKAKGDDAGTSGLLSS